MTRGREDVNITADEKGPLIDVTGVEQATAALLKALGYDPINDEGIVDTPRRVAKFYAEFFGRQIEQFTTFGNTATYDETVVCRNIEFASLCEHHLLPFRGVAHVAYKPDKKVAGLSKLARVVDIYAGRLQLQEQLTVQIADLLVDRLEPKGVAVQLEAEHLCMAIRGIKRPRHSTITTAVRGIFADDPAARQEILHQLAGR